MSILNELAEGMNNLADYDWRQNQMYKNYYKKIRIRAIAGTIVVIVVCIGVMYLRFRVLGR